MKITRQDVVGGVVALATMLICLYLLGVLVSAEKATGATVAGAPIWVYPTLDILTSAKVLLLGVVVVVVIGFMFAGNSSWSYEEEEEFSDWWLEFELDEGVRVIKREVKKPKMKETKPRPIIFRKR